jgi:hypothetical protein
LPVPPHRRKPGSHRGGPGCTAACYSRFPVVKLLLLSILVATFVLPMAAAKVRQPRRALLSLLLLMLAVEVCYAVFLAVFYRRYSF